MKIQQIAAVLLMTSFSTLADGARLLTDFTEDAPSFDWTVVNDSVMGGRSDGDFSINDGKFEFAGRTNTRGGGFSSIRARTDTLDLSAFEGIRLRIKGDGRPYQWLIQTNARFRGQRVSFWGEFPTEPGEWNTVELPFSSFVPRFRGMELRGEPLMPAEIRGMGVMIYDGKDGPFKLVIDSVSVY